MGLKNRVKYCFSLQICVTQLCISITLDIMVTGSSDKSVDDSLSDTENRSHKDIPTVTTRDNKRILKPVSVITTPLFI